MPFRRLARDTGRHALGRLALALAFAIGIQVPVAQALLLDDFQTLDEWSASASEGVRVELAQDEGRRGMGLRLDFDFQGKAGYVVARRPISLPLPDDYAFTFYIRGDAPENNLEIKLVDASGENVWWSQQPHFEFSERWRKLTIKKRHIEFGWGPDQSELREVAAIEFAIAAGRGGAGSVWIDQLTFAERDLGPYDRVPELSSSTSTEGHPAAAALDDDPASIWRSGAVAEEQWLLIDFLEVRELGGLVIDWASDDFAATYDVQLSDDQVEWRSAFRVEAGNGGRDYIYLPETDARYLRLDLERSSRGSGYGIAAIDVKPYQFATSINDFFGAIAADSTRGTYPRYYSHEQSYWTVVGVPGDTQRALIDEAGMVEPGEGWGAVEPFLYVDDQLITWNDVEASQSLEGGYLPVPTVTWQPKGAVTTKLEITTVGAGPPGRSSLWLRYRISNPSPEPRQGRLFLALRPFRVNPPWQTLNGGGGAVGVAELVYDDGRVIIDRDKTLLPLTTPERFGAARFEDGSIVEYLKAGTLPEQSSAKDQFGYASGALEFLFDLEPGGQTDVIVVAPLHHDSARLVVDAAGPDSNAPDPLSRWAAAFETAVAGWRRALDRVEIELPGEGGQLVDALETTLGHILVSADGPALQPGPRAYKRSWIRDGALISAALLRMAQPEPVREFIEWYAPFQFEDGGVPCCVDWRGADLAVEHDSHGQWVFLLAEYYRFTRDVGLLAELWPGVVAAVEHIETLRQRRRTAAYEQGEALIYYGLVPESISHEGYIQNPVHSYWDGFFTLLGLKDAVRIATILGEDEQAATFANIRDQFRADLYASIDRSMAHHGIAFIPGAAELGDFDFTSTAVAIDPVGELAHLPAVAFAETFEEYFRYFSARKTDREGEARFERYTPYEFRIVGPLIRMGRREEAREILDFLFAGRRPAAWNGWAEVVWRDPRAPGFIGDMPHTWVGAEYIRAVRTMLVYERESDESLVVGAGLRPEWVLDDAGVRVRRLPTYHGTLNYTYRRQGESALAVTLGGDVRLPPGGIVLPSPLDEPLIGVTVNGQETPRFSATEAVIEQFPATVVLRYRALPVVEQPGLENTGWHDGIAASPPSADHDR